MGGSCTTDFFSGSAGFGVVTEAEAGFGDVIGAAAGLLVLLAPEVPYLRLSSCKIVKQSKARNSVPRRGCQPRPLGPSAHHQSPHRLPLFLQKK